VPFFPVSSRGSARATELPAAQSPRARLTCDALQTWRIVRWRAFMLHFRLSNEHVPWHKRALPLALAQ